MFLMVVMVKFLLQMVQEHWIIFNCKSEVVRGSITFKTFGTDSIMVGDDSSSRTIDASNYPYSDSGVDVFASLATGSV